MITRVILDLDDVLNRMTMHFLRHVGCPVGENYDSYNPAWGDNLVAVANMLLGEERFDRPGFWNAIPRQAWAECPPSDEMGMILQFAEDLVGCDSICIATSPTKDPDCLAGKLEWITAHLPARLHRQYEIGPRKHFLAMSEALLIDDNDGNVARFRKWGGHAILVPRPFNSFAHLDTATYLNEQFAKVKQDIEWGSYEVAA